MHSLRSMWQLSLLYLRLNSVLLILGVILGLHSPILAWASCEEALIQGLSKEDIAKLEWLIEEKSKSPKISSGRVKKAYRGLRGSVSEFDPIARPYREGFDEIYITERPSVAATYALANRDDSGRVKGYLLELEIPVKFMKAGAERVRLSQFHDHDLAPYISKIGIVDFNLTEFLEEILVKSNQEKEKIKSSLQKLIQLRNPWAKEMRQKFKDQDYELSSADLETLNYMIERRFLGEAFEKGDPRVIQWISLDTYLPQ